MKKLIAFIGLVVLCFYSVGCSSLQNNLERTMLNVGNGNADIKCYSGGQVIYEGTSIGKVTDDVESDGFFFRDKDGFAEIAADCVFRYK